MQKDQQYEHILSVIAESPYQPPETPKSHLTIPVNDVESAVLIKHFPAGIAFIKNGLEEGGKVLVHCAAGVSRSATVCTLPKQNLEVAACGALPGGVSFKRQLQSLHCRDLDKSVWSRSVVAVCQCTVSSGRLT